MKPIGKKTKPITKFMPDEVREMIINHVARHDVRDDSDLEEDMAYLLINGCPGLKNMSDKELIEALFECCPID